MRGPREPRILESIDVETEEIASERESWPVRAGVRLTIYEKAEDRAIGPSGHRVILDDPITRSPDHPIPLTYGTRLRILAKLHPARNYRNPGAFDYEGYLRDNGISVLGSAEATDIERLPGFSGSRIELWRTRVHSSIVAKIHQLWPASQASLMDAMVLGEESFLHNATRTEYQRSGTYHVLVVSGMNLSILAFAIFWTLRQFRVDPAVSAIATVAVSFAYAFVVGVGPPVWRAALMLATYLGARLLYRERNMMNAIGAAALGVLIADPHALFGASFQLTFLAVFIIAGIGSPILERTTLPYARGLRLLRAASYDLHVPPEVAQFRLDLRMIGARLKQIHRRPPQPGAARDHDARGNWRERIDLHLGADAGGTGAADGVSLSSRDHHGNAGQPGGDSAHPSADALCRRRRRIGIHLDRAGQARGLDFRPRARRNRGNGALAGRSASRWNIDCRSACRHALARDDLGLHCRACARHVGSAGALAGPLSHRSRCFLGLRAGSRLSLRALAFAPA